MTSTEGVPLWYYCIKNIAGQYLPRILLSGHGHRLVVPTGKSQHLRHPFLISAEDGGEGPALV